MPYILKTFLLLIFCLFPMASFAAESFKIDEQHSYVLFEVRHFDFTTQSGKWFVTGNLILDEQAPENTKVNIKVPIRNVITGIPKLDKHLNSALFFSSEDFPTASFESIKVTQTGKDTARMEGKLTMKGVTKLITIDVKLNKQGINPITDKYTVGFTGKTKLNRSDFGIKTLIPGVSDEVNLTLQVEAFKEKKTDAS